MSSVFSMEVTKLQEQAQQVLAILEDVYGHSPWTKEQICNDLLNPEVDYFFVYDEAVIVGFLALQHLVGESELTNLAIKKSYQGRGLGKQLLHDLDDLDYPIFLEVRVSNRLAQQLYQSFGFVPIGQRKHYYQQPLEDAVLMKRETVRN